jgi:starch synthase
VRALSVASEIFPLVKTGGLADVVGALPAALGAEGIEMRTMIPGYPAVMRGLDTAAPIHTFEHLHGGPARLLAGRASGLEVLVLDAPHLFARAGNPYSGPGGNDWPDNGVRFAALSRAAAAVALGDAGSWVPDVVHAHDWQAGLTAAYLHYANRPRPGTVMTVHNLAFQGQYPTDLLATIGLPTHALGVDGIEYYGSIGYLKAGLALSDRATTVSPTYAAEVTTAEHGMGLDGVLRARPHGIDGILNGIDVDVWDPANDPHLAATYDAKRLTARAANKRALQRELGLAERPDALLCGVVSRLTWQKGMDLLSELAPWLASQGAQLALLGAGDARLEGAFRDLARTHAGAVGIVIGYDEGLAHRIQAGSDALLVPSRFEPCGLTQLCALRYGALPVVARVGGLADTVVDANEMALAGKAGTGVQFAPVTRDAFGIALARTLRLWHARPTWRALQRRAMATDVSWSRPAARYAALYRDVARVANRRTD